MPNRRRHSAISIPAQATPASRAGCIQARLGADFPFGSDGCKVRVMTISRLFASILALVATGLALSGCTTTSYTCSGGTCTVTLSGPGASAEVESACYTVDLLEAYGTHDSFYLFT